MKPALATARVLHAAALATALLLPAGPVLAGSIGFRTDAEVTAGPGIDVKVTLTHTGDEKADDVTVVAELLDRRIEGTRVAAMDPGRSETWDLHLFDELPKGVYVIVLRTRYTDTNGYPFETVSTATATVGVQPAPRIFGNLDLPRIPVDGETSGKLVAKRPPGRSGDYQVRLLAPAGLDVDPKEARLAFDATGRASADFRVRNRKLLQGTTVNVFALVDGNANGHPQTDAIRAAVRITAATPKVSSPLFYTAAAATFLLLVVLEAAAWRTNVRSTNS